jgi:mannosyltransferase
VTVTATKVAKATGLRDALILGAAGTAVSVAGSWIPSLWHDEAATISAATRSVPELFHLLRTVDVVHGLYYLLMHVWTSVAGSSPFAMRLPSALAAGLAVAALVLLMQRTGSRSAALLSGAALILLPRFAWAGVEARSPALTMLMAVVLTAVLLEASGRRDRGPWVAYGILLVLSGLLFLDLVLLIPAHAVTLLLLRRGPPRGFIAAIGAAAIVLVPFGLLAASQSEQLFWVAEPGPGSWYDVLVVQYFGANWPLAILVAVLLVVGFIARRSAAPVLAIAVPALVLPVALLLVASLLLEPLYVARYLTFTTPALAACLGVALASLRRTGIVGLVVLALVAAPTIIAERMPEAKDSAWASVAQIVSEHRTDDTEGILWGSLTRFPRVPARALGIAYPDAFAGMDDLTLDIPPGPSGTLWGVGHQASRSDLAGLDTVWVIGADDRWSVELRNAGFSRTAQWHELELEVVRYQR